MKLSASYADFSAAHPHIPLPLTPADRANLPETQWDSYTAPSYQHQRSTNALGQWFIGHPMRSNQPDGEPVELKYQLHLPKHTTYKDISTRLKEYDTKDLEWFQLFAHQREQTLGTLLNQDFCKRFVDLARHQQDGADPIQRLTEAGFTEATNRLPVSFQEETQEAIRKFTLPDAKRGVFTGFLYPSGLHLTHEKRNATSWTTLINLHMGTVSHDGKAWIPAFWSPEVSNPLAAMAEMAAVFTREWEPAQRQTRKPK